MTQNTPIYQPYLTGNEALYVNDALKSTWISSKGPYIKDFEEAFAQYLNIKHATTVSNGTVALHLALTALGVQEGDEVIVPTFTYVASVNTIKQTGATPIFIDSELDSLQMNIDEVLKKITSKTKAVMAVHLYGMPVDIVKLQKICKEKKLFLIEDCAESLGTTVNNQHLGTFGDIATFSFFGNKTVTTGEGGMVVCNDDDLMQRAYRLKNQGLSTEREYWHDVLAFNYRMTNITAAIGVAQMEKIENILLMKNKIADQYAHHLADLPLRVLQPSTYLASIYSIRSSYWLCTLVFEDANDTKPIRQRLKDAGIETRPAFPPVHTMPHHKTNEHFPIAEKIAVSAINIPSYPELTEQDIKRICHIISQYYSK